MDPHDDRITGSRSAALSSHSDGSPDDQISPIRSLRRLRSHFRAENEEDERMEMEAQNTELWRENRDLQDRCDRLQSQLTVARKEIEDLFDEQNEQHTATVVHASSARPGPQLAGGPEAQSVSKRSPAQDAERSRDARLEALEEQLADATAQVEALIKQQERSRHESIKQEEEMAQLRAQVAHLEDQMQSCEHERDIAVQAGLRLHEELEEVRELLNQRGPSRDPALSSTTLNAFRNYRASLSGELVGNSFRSSPCTSKASTPRLLFPTLLPARRRSTSSASSLEERSEEERAGAEEDQQTQETGIDNEQRKLSISIPKLQLPSRECGDEADAEVSFRFPVELEPRQAAAVTLSPSPPSAEPQTAPAQACPKAAVGNTSGSGLAHEKVDDDAARKNASSNSPAMSRAYSGNSESTRSRRSSVDTFQETEPGSHLAAPSVSPSSWREEKPSEAQMQLDLRSLEGSVLDPSNQDLLIGGSSHDQSNNNSNSSNNNTNNNSNSSSSNNTNSNSSSSSTALPGPVYTAVAQPAPNNGGWLWSLFSYSHALPPPPPPEATPKPKMPKWPAPAWGQSIVQADSEEESGEEDKKQDENEEKEKEKGPSSTARAPGAANDASAPKSGRQEEQVHGQGVDDERVDLGDVWDSVLELEAEASRLASLRSDRRHPAI